MTEDSLNILRNISTLDEKMPIIINAFVAFYGEDKRKFIEERFKNTLMVVFRSPFSLQDNIGKVKVSLLKEVLNLPEDVDFYFSIDELVYWLEGKSFLSSINNKDKELLFHTIYDDEILDNYRKGLYPKIREFVTKYRNIQSILKPYQEEYDNEEKRNSELNQKYYDILVNEFAYLFSKEELEEYNKTKKPTRLMKKYLGDYLSAEGNCFDEECEKELSNPNCQWKQASIISDRLGFLNTLGVCPEKYKGNILEPTYKDYLDDQRCREVINYLIEICTKISKREKELLREKTVEFVEGLKDYKRCRQIIDSKPFLQKDDPLGIYVYMSPISCFQENYIFDGSNYIFSPLVLINVGLRELDCAIIHELNHAFEYTTISVDENGSNGLCGWEFDSDEFKTQREMKDSEYKGITRPYELLNEYVNDRIAQEITDILHSSGNYIYEKKRSNKTSDYMSMGILLEDFYITFKEVIIQSRFNGNISYIYDTLGAENFEALNTLINRFFKEYGFGNSALEHINNYINKTNEEDVKKIEKYVQEKNIIIKRMEEHLFSILVNKNSNVEIEKTYGRE